MEKNIDSAMGKKIDSMFEKKNWVVVGATNNKSKFGNVIYNSLNDSGYNVYPLNPVYDQVEGAKCFNNLSEIEGPIDCVDFVVPPARGLAYVKEAAALGIKQLWFQPGTFNDEVLALCAEHNIEVVYHACVLVELPTKKNSI